MSTTYRFTIRPAIPLHCPKGYERIDEKWPPDWLDYGTVTYPEPLTRQEAEHWSLWPVGNPVVSVRWDDTTYPLDNLVYPEVIYEYLCGQMTKADLQAHIEAKLAEYDNEVTTVELIEA
jgi:hypothetical protein